MTALDGEDGMYWVPDVHPTESGRLIEDEYNTIIVDFYTKILRPIAPELGILVQLSA